MLIQNIHLEGFRNIKITSKLNFHPYLNIIYGMNGSGKSNLLESIYFLALGRSFRTSKINNLIRFDSEFLAVHATYSDRNFEKQIKINCLKYYNQHRISKIGGTIATNIEVANLTPTQLVNDETSRLIFKEPELRRKFLDWLAFYGNKNYQGIWQKFQSILKQRNKILKQLSGFRNHQYKETLKLLQKIDLIFIELSKKITCIRKEIWDKFQLVWLDIIQDLNITNQLITELKLIPGWSGNLTEQLLINLDLDIQQGVTHYGPHKADLQFKVNGKLARDTLSKGQGKLVAFALILARTKFIKEVNLLKNFVSVLLIDDISSELDDININKILTALFYYKHDLQIFITSAEYNRILSIVAKEEAKWFKIADGVIE